MSASTRRVRFEYCISLVFLTWRRESELVQVPAGWPAFLAGLPYCLITLVLGWWGVPWGIFLTPVVLWNNIRGGRVVAEFEAGGCPNAR
jgi:hypothetical protein